MNRVSKLWLLHLERLLEIGELTGSREGETLELLNKTIRYPMDDWEIQVPERKLNKMFIVDEASFALSGNIFPTTSTLHNVLSPWLDVGGAYSGAYGPKFLGQIPYIMDTLRAKPGSRQAVINIWPESPRTSFEAPGSEGKTKNVPCLISMHFLVRNSKLNCFVTMRSSDAWLGLPNDIGVYALMAQYVARALMFEYGDIILNMHSAHIYRKHYTVAEELVKRYKKELTYETDH